MALDLWIDSRSRTIHLRLRGPVTTGEPRRYISELLDHPHFSPDFKILADARDVGQVDVTHKDMLGLAEHLRAIRDRLGSSRIAIVTCSDVVFGLARMYQQLRHDSRYEIQVFRQLESAREWLAEEAVSPVAERGVFQPGFVTP